MYIKKILKFVYVFSDFNLNYCTHRYFLSLQKLLHHHRLPCRSKGSVLEHTVNTANCWHWKIQLPPPKFFNSSIYRVKNKKTKKNKPKNQNKKPQQTSETPPAIILLTNQATRHLRLLCSFKGKQSELQKPLNAFLLLSQFLLGGYRAEKQLCINKAHQSLEKWGTAYRNIIHCRICLAHKIMATDYDSCVACFCHHFEERKRKK